ncbi:MAG: hypothetical protein PVH87_15925 [Desulfobacteraceae bacterium]|jgi:hypothetical protein
MVIKVVVGIYRALMANSGPLIAGGIAQEAAILFNDLKTIVKIYRKELSKWTPRHRQLVTFGSMTA